MAAQAVEDEFNEFDLEEFARNLPDEYLECRKERHHRYESSFKHKRKQRVYEDFQVCQRCGKWRLELVGDDNSEAPGEVLDVKEGRYPKNYLAIGSGRITKDDMKVIRLARAKRRTRETKSIPKPLEE